MRSWRRSLASRRGGDAAVRMARMLDDLTLKVPSPGTSDGDAAAGLDRPTGKRARAGVYSDMVPAASDSRTLRRPPPPSPPATRTPSLSTRSLRRRSALLAALSANATVAAPRALFDVAAAASQTAPKI